MKRRVVSVVFFMAFLLTASAWSYDGTIATFSDPSPDSSSPLFTVDGTTVNGGWLDSQTGLNLQVILTGATYNDAFFTMDQITAGGGGTIKFYENNETPGAVPLFQIAFASSQLSTLGLGGDNIFNFNGVAFSGRALDGYSILGSEVFAFSFANLKSLSQTHRAYSATAAFTSSAEATPEPATLALLGLGLLGLRRRK